MATVNLGSIKFKWKGTYAGGTAYTIDDVVSYNGSSYICIQASTGNLPTDTAYFEQMSSAGTNGTDGTDVGTTITTQGDILYRDGSGLARLGAGTSGQVLQTGGSGANPSWVDASSGKVLQTKRSENSSIVSSNQDTNKNFNTNNASTNGAQIVTLNITPLSTTSHFYCWYHSTDGVNGNNAFVNAMYHGTSLVNHSIEACYAGDVSSSDIFGIVDTTSLSGSQTIQVRNMGAVDSGFTHYTNADHNGNANSSTATLVVMEIED